jgi:CBS domain containing-hemolysin-like protein
LSGLLLDGLLVVLALFLVALNGLFVAAEFGLVKIRSTQVDGSRVARVVARKEPS